MHSGTHRHVLAAVYERNSAEQYRFAVCAHVPAASVYTCHHAPLSQEIHLLEYCQFSDSTEKSKAIASRIRDTAYRVRDLQADNCTIQQLCADTHVFQRSC
jgi:hypothetical protein